MRICRVNKKKKKMFEMKISFFYVKREKLKYREYIAFGNPTQNK